MSEQLIIRPGTIEDLEPIRACVTAAYSPYVSVIGREPAAMTTDFARHLSDGQVHVGTLSGELTGLILAIDEPDFLEIRSVAVLPSRQRMGIGLQLINYAEGLARSLGHSTVRLYTNAKLQGLVEMYEAMGFIRLDRRWDGGYERVFMTKEI